MQPNPILSLLTLTLALTTTAQAQYTNQSAPFNLILQSPDSSINGDSLASCHEGAAIESLCLASATGISAVAYNFNTSAFSGDNGFLTYVLRGANFNESEPLTFFYNPASNVVLPLFEPSESAVSVGFDESDLMFVAAYYDDRTNPVNPAEQRYYRWYACSTYFEGYNYQTLAWVLGDTEPQNPTCIKTDVKRVFV